MKPISGFYIRKNLLALAMAALTMTLFLSACSDSKAPGPLTKEQTAAMTELIEKTLMEKPEIVQSALQAFKTKQGADKEKQAQKVLETQAKNIFDNPNDPVGGNPGGDVTLVEFFDYRCGFCKKVHDDVMKLVSEDKELKYVYKEFPILGPQSTFAARAALASVPQGKYARFSDALMRSDQSLTEDAVTEIAQGAGIDLAVLMKELLENGKRIEGAIRDNYKLAVDLQINGTPGFIVGKRIIRGAVDFDTLKNLVAEARKAKKQGV